MEKTWKNLTVCRAVSELQPDDERRFLEELCQSRSPHEVVGSLDPSVVPIPIPRFPLGFNRNPRVLRGILGF